MINDDYTVLFFARIKSNENEKSCYKVGKTQCYDITLNNKNLKRTANDRFKELKSEFGNEFFETKDIIIIRQIVIDTSVKVVYNSKFCEHAISNMKKSSGGYFKDCYEISYEMYQLLMEFFDSYSNKFDDLTNTNYTILSNGKEYNNEQLIKDIYYKTEDYLNEDEENWSLNDDNGSHLIEENEELSDNFIASDDDIESDGDEEYLPRKKQRV